MKKIASIVLSLFFLISCGKPLPDLSSMNIENWKNDRGGCKNERVAYADVLTQKTEELKGLSEDQVIKLLGRPDRNELYKRNQKFYYYDIEPGKGCDASQASNLQLVFRFNAMSRAKEVSLERL